MNALMVELVEEPHHQQQHDSYLLGVITITITVK